MNTDDGQRMNMQNHGMRKPMAQKYPEKNPNYSPSTSYNYSPQTGYNGGNSQTFQRRRPGQDRFRRDASPNPNDKLLRQNDIIIRLLKEIRDRLPPPNVTAASAEVEPAADATIDPTQASETWEGENQDHVPAAEKADESLSDDEDKNDARGNTDEIQ